MTEAEVYQIHGYIDEYRRVRRRHRGWSPGSLSPIGGDCPPPKSPRQGRPSSHRGRPKTEGVAPPTPGVRLPAGVTWNGHRYVAQIHTAKTTKYVGSFDDPEAAGRAASDARAERDGAKRKGVA